MKTLPNKSQIPIAAFIIVAGIVLTLFRNWEPTGETWRYWWFARIFAETGKFPIIDRSPLWVLYLNLFRWLGYPASVTVEYILTLLILAISLIILFKRYLGLPLAAFAVFLWFPFFQNAEPSVQNLALACSCLAIVLRTTKPTRFRLTISYALLGCAYMLASSYIIFVLIFVVWDSIKFFRKNNLRDALIKIRPKLHDWPILFALILLTWFNIMQSSNPHNNAWCATATWFPTKPKKLFDVAFIHHHNWYYIFGKYGTFKDQDFYFTNQELFNGADDMIGAIRANPKFVAGRIARNIKDAFSLVASFTALPRFFYTKSAQAYLHYVIFLFFIIPFILAVLYGAFRACKSQDMVLFVISNILIFGTSIMFAPKTRYMHTFIPVLILSAFWYGDRIRNRVKNLRLSYFIIFTFLIFFSNSITRWGTIAGDIARDISQGEIRVMERQPYSLKASFKSIEPLIQNCNGVLSLEHCFFGAFTDIPLDKNYDIWEIPPFGHLGDSDYDGLRPDRIDCLLVSHELATGVGVATNYQIRYQNYIRPYIKELKDKGAKIYDIKEFGQAIILWRE